MTPDDVRTVDVETHSAPTRLRIIDCDVHPAMRSAQDLKSFLAQRWRDHLDTYGSRLPIPFTGSSPYPKAAPALSRTDAWPPGGGPPGSDLDFLRAQLLDAYDMDFGILHLLAPTGMDQRNQEFGAAICRAINEWTVETWTRPEPRLKGSIVVPGEDATAAVAEIEHWAGHPGFVQVAMTTHTIEPLGRRRYWPIYEAAAANGLPVGLHTSGFNGHAVTGTGWSSFYVEEHHEVAISQQALTTSLVCEGVFARLPSLKVVIVEAGFAWVPSLAWRLDQHWARMRDEVPHLTRPPSEYIRENMWFTTQPMDEPERPRDLRDVIGWIGWDRILFATDYPHWDFDDPLHAFKIRLTDTEKRMVFADNARQVYHFA
jgi:predicted TIM-barrel fold metal-dependent hydrolase